MKSPWYHVGVNELPKPFPLIAEEPVHMGQAGRNDRGLCKSYVLRDPVMSSLGHQKAETVQGISDCCPLSQSKVPDELDALGAI